MKLLAGPGKFSWAGQTVWGCVVLKQCYSLGFAACRSAQVSLNFELTQQKTFVRHSGPMMNQSPGLQIHNPNQTSPHGKGLFGGNPVTAIETWIKTKSGPMDSSY